ncbi:hypothetical protein LTR78_009359 [Recurvomyces mirabilis]|uniref:Uncharacterized protein n=1 Tax=Recurvomyces mirabilis TaxID=574656 RepID=A0AAE0TNT6_9PEZI|nr:hypothetical protein LTR78_009359 [Recurvomyces mirabilis]
MAAHAGLDTHALALRLDTLTPPPEDTDEDNDGQDIKHEANLSMDVREADALLMSLGIREFQFRRLRAWQRSMRAASYTAFKRYMIDITMRRKRCLCTWTFESIYKHLPRIY